MPKGRDDVPRAFVPSGWLDVQREALNKERRQMKESARGWQLARDRVGGRARPVAGWAWFSQNGFCDTMDRARMVQERYAGSRAGIPPAGVGTADEEGIVLRSRVAPKGREGFLARSEVGLITQLTATGSHLGPFPATMTASQLGLTSPKGLSASASAPQLAAGLSSSRGVAAALGGSPGKASSALSSSGFLMASAGMSSLPKTGLQLAAVTIGSEETYREGLVH